MSKRAIADLTTQKANSRGQFDKFEDNDVARMLRFKAQQEEELTREQTIRQKIEAEPTDIANYLELAQLHINNERYEEAEDVLAEAYEASDGNLDIREKWEDVQLRHLRKNLAAATAPEDKRRLQQEYREKDVEVWRHRVERYPGHISFKYELGYRYMLVGRYEESIRELQTAQNDPPRRGVCLLALGQCFQQVKQYRLAMNYYELAIQEIPDRDAENRKYALYLAGRLAFALKDVGTAGRHLTALASLDFNYRDNAALLEKLREVATCQRRQAQGTGETATLVVHEGTPS